jgi:hypothetical protein
MLAEPLANVPVPSNVAPLINVTDSPLGGAPMLDVTVAVKVTACACMDGFGEDEAVVVVASITT